MSGEAATGEDDLAQAHILVVDDDARIRDLLRRFLARHGYTVTAARDAAHAGRLLTSQIFDLLIVDVMMPGEDGISFARRMRGETGAPILLLTARGDVEDRISGLEAGADDYLVKPFEPRELLLRCAAILHRAKRPVELALGRNRYDVLRGELLCDGKPVRLTTAERALMRVFAARPNETVSRERLAGKLGGGGEVRERAVDVQIARLRRKLEADPKNPRCLRSVRGSGYMLTPD